MWNSSIDDASGNSLELSPTLCPVPSIAALWILRSCGSNLAVRFGVVAGFKIAWKDEEWGLCWAGRFDSGQLSAEGCPPLEPGCRCGFRFQRLRIPVVHDAASARQQRLHMPRCRSSSVVNR